MHEAHAQHTAPAEHVASTRLLAHPEHHGFFDHMRSRIRRLTPVLGFLTVVSGATKTSAAWQPPLDRELHLHKSGIDVIASTRGSGIEDQDLYRYRYDLTQSPQTNRIQMGYRTDLTGARVDMRCSNAWVTSIPMGGTGQTIPAESRPTATSGLKLWYYQHIARHAGLDDPSLLDPITEGGSLYTDATLDGVAVPSGPPGCETATGTRNIHVDPATNSIVIEVPVYGALARRQSDGYGYGFHASFASTTVPPITEAHVRYYDTTAGNIVIERPCTGSGDVDVTTEEQVYDTNGIPYSRNDQETVIVTCP